MFKLFFRALLFFVIVAGIFYILMLKPKTIESYRLNIKSGQGWVQVAKVLAQDGIVMNEEQILLWARLLDSGGALKSGVYQLDGDFSPYGVVRYLISTKPTLDMQKIRLIEGQTLAQFRRTLDMAELKHHSGNLSEPQIASQLHIAYSNLEGQFLADTYLLEYGADDWTVYRQAHEALKSALEAAWNDRADNLPYKNAYELLIVASLIEKESGNDEDRAYISAVFANRLRKGMRLQTDPSVIYGLGESYRGTIYKSDLETDTPYNTYTRAGLPPTPIATVSKSSLQAAAHPADAPYLYFVARQDGTGKSQFSVTLDDHNAAVRRYLRNPSK